MRRSLLPFIGDALNWLTETATTDDVNSIKTRINQLIATQHNQQETLVHTISILNVTRYSTQVNMQHINIVMNAVEKMHQDVMTLYNITHSLYSNLSYQQIVLHIQTILANFWDSLYYMREVTIHTMDYMDAVTTGNTLTTCTTHRRSPRNAITHWGNTSFHHALPISSEDVLHFYRYLCTHVLIADEQFPLMIDVPIQDHAQQLEIYKVFNLAIPHGNFSAHYNIQNRYLA